MLNILLAYLLMVKVNSELIGNIFRCPTKTERRLFGSHRSCPNNAVYHCIRDERNGLVETCNEPKLIPKGNFPIYLNKSDQIYYTSCPTHLYQPLPKWSFEISDCEYKKSACNGIGQVICDTGSTTEDATCKCDYKRGYVINGENKCCSPSLSDECYCQYFTCGNQLQELDKDFKCINMCLPGYERSAQNTCKPKSNTTWSSLPAAVSTTRTPISFSDRTDQFTIDYRKNALGHCANVVYSLLLTYIIKIFITSKWLSFRLTCLKVLFCFGFGGSLSFFFGYCVGLHTARGESFAYALALLIIVFVCTTCYFVYFLSVHDMITEPEVYNEEYDKRIYRLLEAASRGNLKEIKRLTEEDYIDTDVVDINGRSALHLAACSNQKKTVEFIINKYICFPEAKDRWNRSARDDAKWHKTQYLDSSYDPTISILSSYRNRHYRRNEWEKKKCFKETKAMELVTAANKGDIRTIKRLHEMKTDMNLANSKGQTALHAAVEKGRTNIVKYLIDVCEVSPFVRWSGRRPIDIIPTDRQAGIETMIKKLQCYMSYLLEYTPDDSVKEIVSLEIMIVRLLNCASKGDIKQMKRFQASGYRMNMCNYDFQTALHIAVMENQEHIVDFLLKKCKQADIALKAKDRWNTTPWETAKKSAMQCVKYVFFDNCPETLEAENDTIYTFHLLNAARRGDLQTLKILHQENVDMNKQDHNGKTALHFAVLAKQTKAVQFLVHDAKVDLFIPDRYNILPMDEDIHEDITDRIKNYQNGIKKEQNELKMSTQEDTLVLVMKACANGILHKQTDLRYKYFNMDSCNYDGDTPLHVAAANGKLEDVMYLLRKRKTCLFVRNSFWKRPMDVVEEKVFFWKQRTRHPCNPTMIEKLYKIKYLIEKAVQNALDQHTDIDRDAAFEKLSNEERIFLFQYRVFKGDILAIRRFVKTDATLINQLDYDDRSPLHIAAAAGHTHLVEFLLNKGAKKYRRDKYNLTPLDEAKMNGDNIMQYMLTD